MFASDTYQSIAGEHYFLILYKLVRLPYLAAIIVYHSIPINAKNFFLSIIVMFLFLFLFVSIIFRMMIFRVGFY